jgi:predicted dehydrogenase
MLAAVACDAVAIGDYYSKRGSLAIRALRAGKHVIADKPLCTDLKELDEIEKLSKQKNLAVGCQMDFRSAAPCITAIKLLRSGIIGEIHTVAVSGQHPLMWGTRPAWYFQKGCHGGTINDIFVHAADAIELLTGRKFVEVVAARAWNADLPEAPLFQNAAQIMLRMDNNAGVIGDVSYLAADKCGFGMSNYWRYTLHGRNGLMEFTYNSKTVMVTTHADSQPQYIPVEPGPRRQYLADFLNQIKGNIAPNALDNGTVLRAARVAMLAQHAADTSTVHMPC